MSGCSNIGKQTWDASRNLQLELHYNVDYKCEKEIKKDIFTVTEDYTFYQDAEIYYEKLLASNENEVKCILGDKPKKTFLNNAKLYVAVKDYLSSVNSPFYKYYPYIFSSFAVPKYKKYRNNSLIDPFEKLQFSAIGLFAKNETQDFEKLANAGSLPAAVILYKHYLNQMHGITDVEEFNKFDKYLGIASKLVDFGDLKYLEYSKVVLNIDIYNAGMVEVAKKYVSLSKDIIPEELLKEMKETCERFKIINSGKGIVIKYKDISVDEKYGYFKAVDGACRRMAKAK